MIRTFSTGIDMRLFRRRGRHDLYGRTPTRNDVDDDASIFNEEEYEDDDMFNPPNHRHHNYNNHHRRHIRRRFIILATALLIAVLLTWLVLLPNSQLNNYPKADGVSTIATLQIQKTHSLWSEYIVTGTYRDASGHEQPVKAQRVAGNKIIVEIDLIQFPASASRYQLIAASGQYINVLQQHTIPAGDASSIQFNTENNGYLNMIKAHPILAPTVGIITCDITLGPMKDYNSHSFIILVINGTCSKQQLH